MTRTRPRRRQSQKAAGPAGDSASTGTPGCAPPTSSGQDQQNNALFPTQHDGDQRARATHQYPPDLNANKGLHTFNSGTGYHTPQTMDGLNPFSMALAQPNLFSGLQPLPMPNMVPNMMPYMMMDPSFGMYQQGGSPNAPPQNNPYLPANLQSFYVGHPSAQAQHARPSIPPTPPQDNGMSTPTQSIAKEVSIPSRTKTDRDQDRMPITAPSAASGGVPNPTDAYMMRASFLSKRRTHPGPLLVVIDLNGTLLHRPNKRNSSNFNARHHARHFIKYCVDTFWVVIWSSARPDNVKRMVNGLLSPSALQQVIAVWGRDKFGLTAHDYKVRTQCYKRLTSLWDDPMVQSSYPSTRKGFENGCWDQGNTVLIDDSAEKARSEPHNAITLPEFTGDMAEEGDILPKVHDYLNELCYQEDVSTYMRANPFKMA